MIESEALSRRHLAACAVARQAGDMMRRLFQNRSGIEMSFKGPQDYLTQADAAVEKLVRQRLAEAFPQDKFLGEEGGGEVSQSMWVVDPIDGTSNFARGIPHFCISIAYALDQTPEIGVIYDPMTDEMFEAQRGAGGRVNGRPMKTSDATKMEYCQIELGWSSRRTNDAYLAIVRRVLEAGASFRRAGSGALGIAYVADGRSDGYAELHINSWDCLAGIVMVKEAGGYANDFLAGDGMLKGNPILVAAPGVAQALIKLTGIGSKVMA